MITQALVSNGAKVYITGRTEEKLTTVKEHYSAGGSIEVVQGDIVWLLLHTSFNMNARLDVKRVDQGDLRKD